MSPPAETERVRVVIVGAGIAGIVLALALKAHVNLTVEIYEQAPRFDDNAGGAIGLYPNGLRVLRDISPELLGAIRSVGYPYIYRRWMRHDGTQVACGVESAFCPDSTLQSIGIRRWKFQKTLCDFADKESIPIQFGKRLRHLNETDNGKLTLVFEDETVVEADIVFGADGIRSKVRESVFGVMDAQYTGITCLMGSSKNPRPLRGICFPSSITTKCHACYYPTGENEQIFQIYFPTEEKPESWGTLSQDAAYTECTILAQKLAADGWSEDFILPIREADSVIRVGLRAREPLDKWVKGKVALLGDAAHPPVPYIGQGAMMAIEDAGVLAKLMAFHCLEPNLRFDMTKLPLALQQYENIRIARTREVLGASHKLGSSQQKRAESWIYNLLREWWIWLQVQWYGTLPIMFKGATYDYSKAVKIYVENSTR